MFFLSLALRKEKGLCVTERVVPLVARWRDQPLSASVLPRLLKKKHSQVQGIEEKAEKKILGGRFGPDVF